jgi:protein-ribulosamine 3-kinase
MPTHCGLTEQDNRWTDEWLEFYRDRRLGSLLARSPLKEDKELQELGGKVMGSVCEMLIGDGVEGIRPGLVHGDLWSGNWGVRRNEESGEDRPFIFDPSLISSLEPESRLMGLIVLTGSSFSHNEFEFGIMKMFGGERVESDVRTEGFHSYSYMHLGFGEEFFQAYHEIIPRSKPFYEQRLRLYELYHHLNVSPSFI